MSRQLSTKWSIVAVADSGQQGIFHCLRCRHQRERLWRMQVRLETACTTEAMGPVGNLSKPLSFWGSR